MRFLMAGEVNYRGGNKDLRAECFPGYQLFMSEANLKGLVADMNLPRTVGGGDPFTLSEIMELAEEVYNWDVDGRAVECSAVSLAGVDPVCVTALLQKWNQQLHKKLLRKYDTDYGAAVSYNFGYDMGSYLGDFPGYGTGKTGPYAVGAGGFLDDREYLYTSNRLKGHPIDISHEIDLRIPPQTYRL